MKKEEITFYSSCRVCGSKNMETVIKLNPTPSEGAFVSKTELSIKQNVYKLEVAFCKDCSFLQLPYLLSPKISYENYYYETKATIGLIDHFQDYAREILNLVGADENALVLDLGSNDGGMLKAFKSYKMNVLGVEPCKTIAEVAVSHGIPTINEYFTEEVAENIISNSGLASIVTANYMYANIEDIISFTKNVKKVLSSNGTFVVQTGYHPDQMKINMFDWVYHEHYSYFSVQVLRDVYSKCGLEIINVQKIPIRGGCIRVIAQHQGGKRTIHDAVDEIIHDEQLAGMNKIKTYLKFAEEINQIKDKVLMLVREIKSKGETIVGYGASHSTTTLTYFLEISEYLDYIVDDNESKHDKFTPGYHIPIYSTSKLIDEKPDSVILLAWLYQAVILKKNMNYLEQGGKFLVPLPEVRIVNETNLILVEQ